jgi:succinate-acetate transporter protein
MVLLRSSKTGDFACLLLPAKAAGIGGLRAPADQVQVQASGIEKEHDMSPQDESVVTPGPATTTITEAPTIAWAPGPGHAYPATAPGVPLSAFAFAFAVAMLGLVQTGILTSAANDIFIATCFGIGAVGLLIGGLWEFRSGELFGGTFGVGYAGFLISTALILKFFAGPIIVASGVLGFDHAFAAWLILWALFTGVFAIGASSISLAAFAPFSLAFVVLILSAIANLGGTASWTSDVTRISGWFALLDGFAAGYLGAAIVLNVTLSRELLPMWPARSRLKAQ